MTVSSTLADIRGLVRQLTGSPSTTQLTDATIDLNINNFYFYDLPEHVKTFNLKTKYQFFTTPNVEAYNFPKNTYESLQPPLYIAGYESMLTLETTQFYRLYPAINNLETNLVTGNGTLNQSVSFTTSAQPLLSGYVVPANGTIISQVFISTTDPSGKELILRDSPTVTSGLAGAVTGTFLDQNGNPAAGTINYVTGVVTGATFNGTTVSGGEIDVQYIFFNNGRPTMGLLYADMIFLRPVPDKSYNVEFDAYILPTALASSSSTPDLNTWWEFLAFGAARKILSYRLDMDGLQRIEPFFQERMNLAIRRTIQQQSSERTSTIYTEQTQTSQFGLHQGSF